MKKTNNKRPKPAKCSIHKCSLIKRSKIAQTGLSNLVKNQPHPTLEGLYFVCVTSDGRERWQTADEIADRASYQSRYFKKNQSEKSAKVASQRAALKKQNDREADSLILRYGKRGMAKSVWVELSRPVKERLKRMMPNIVWVDEADRHSRRDAEMDYLNELMEQARLDAEQSMKEKMARSRSLHSTMVVAESVTVEEIATNHAKPRKSLTQADLNELSNSRYEMPKCYSAFAEMTEDDDDDEMY